MNIQLTKYYTPENHSVCFHQRSNFQHISTENFEIKKAATDHKQKPFANTTLLCT